MTSNNHFVGEIGQKALIVREGKVLMCHDIGSTSWDFPGGRLNKDEEPKAGLLRELKEELGVEVVVGAPMFTAVKVVTANGIPRFFVVYRAELVDRDATFTLQQGEIEDMRWVGKEDVATLETPPAWREILQTYFQI